MSAAQHTIRPLESAEDLNACVALQEETWGHSFSERVAPSMLKVAAILGGVAAGAFRQDGTLDGFVFGLTGVKDGEVVHWSDMLAVRRSVRDRGLGMRLKHYQRRVLLDRGVRTMLWTFDPLQSRNAHLCFARLGVVVREYVRDMYPRSDSPLHRGIGTDRFVALWAMDSSRVVARVERGEPAPGASVAEGVPAALDARPAEGLPEPGQPRPDLEVPRVTVAIPADISAVMAGSMEVATAWREATRTVLTAYLERGYEVREVLRGERVSRYLLIQASDET